MIFQHLRDINKSYTQHLKFAWWMGYNTGLASFCLFIHGLFPCFFTNAGSNLIKKLCQSLEQNKNYSQDAAKECLDKCR